MCEEDAVQRLMEFNWAGLADEAEHALAFNARNADPRTRPFYSRILYSWYIAKGDFRNGALHFDIVVQSRTWLINAVSFSGSCYVPARSQV
jgi:hypothetical protein